MPACSPQGAGSGTAGGGPGGAGASEGGSGSAGHKVSKAAVLQNIEYIQQVQHQKKKQEEELALLRKELIYNAAGDFP